MAGDPLMRAVEVGPCRCHHKLAFRREGGWEASDGHRAPLPTGRHPLPVFNRAVLSSSVLDSSSAGVDSRSVSSGRPRAPAGAAAATSSGACSLLTGACDATTGRVVHLAVNQDDNLTTTVPLAVAGLTHLHSLRLHHLPPQHFLLIREAILELVH
uniref:Uncharacterized protein n=1 Tax=Oryza rufipogon TaxID=4529 RepID=A0A0E0MWF1_ORYRU